MKCYPRENRVPENHEVRISSNEGLGLDLSKNEIIHEHEPIS